MPRTSHSLHTSKLTNNCPKCYSNSGLEIEVFQEEQENSFYTKASKRLHAAMRCTICDSDIFPVEWDTDLERVVDYHIKKANPKSGAIRLKPLAYLVIIIDAITIGVIIYLLK